MAIDFNTSSDISPDTGNDVSSGDFGRDFGGDLGGDEGVDLNQADTIYPPNDGFVEGTREDVTLQPEDAFDRYHTPPKSLLEGEYEGDVDDFIKNDDPYADPSDAMFVDRDPRYAAPVGTSFEERSMSGDGDDKILTSYEVQNPIEVESGIAAPANDKEGGGIQYNFDENLNDGKNINDMVENGDIRPTSVSFEVDNSDETVNVEEFPDAEYADAPPDPPQDVDMNMDMG